MVLVGDPLLAPSRDVRALLKSSQYEGPTAEELEALRQTLVNMPRLEELDTFEQYRKLNPRFFE
jgi:hypothetical protein